MLERVEQLRALERRAADKSAEARAEFLQAAALAGNARERELMEARARAAEGSAAGSGRVG
jgi:hypothetical protein